VNKNNIFMKFAYCYKVNLVNIKADAVKALGALIYDLLPVLPYLILHWLLVLFRLLCCLIPIWQVYAIFNIEYLTEDELKEKYGQWSQRKKGYYLKLSDKKEIEEIQ